MLEGHLKSKNIHIYSLNELNEALAKVVEMYNCLQHSSIKERPIEVHKGIYNPLRPLRDNEIREYYERINKDVLSSMRSRASVNLKKRKISNYHMSTLL